ncbi:MAG TPA: DUF6527 family protein [Opitutaceae bacterium]|nr:DUF6527 family protein [Opitutaceae bacterium]
MNTESCDCRKVADYDAVERPGDFYFQKVEGMEGETQIHLMLPSHTFICLGVARGSSATPKVWGWDGNEEKPTLEPSIHTIGHWHGYLRNGRLQSC